MHGMIPKRAVGLVRVVSPFDWGIPVPVSAWSASCADGRCGFLWLPVAVSAVKVGKSVGIGRQNGSERLREPQTASCGMVGMVVCIQCRNGQARTKSDKIGQKKSEKSDKSG